MSETNEEMMKILIRTQQILLDKLENNLHTYHLRVNEFAVLDFLQQAGRQPIQKIAETIFVTSGTITYILDKLSKKDYIMRKRCPKDKRIFYAELTPQGHQLIEKIHREYPEFLENLFAGFPDIKKESLLTTLRELYHQIQK